MGQASGAARVEGQRPGVQWPTVTRPADNTDAPLLLPAPRSCVCGHPVYDEDPKCPLCACQEHKPRQLTARDHSTSATAWSGVGEGRRGSQPELPGGRQALPASATPAIRCQRHPAVGRRGAQSPRAGATVPGAGPGHPARRWSPSPPACWARQISGARCFCLRGAAYAEVLRRVVAC
jgi:hypothetical protein